MNRFYIGNIEVWYGKHSLGSCMDILEQEIAKRVFLVTDAGVVASGLTDTVTAMLTEHAIPYLLYQEITPNPKVEEIRRGVALARDFEVDFIIAVGGGSVMDSAKIISAMLTNEGDILEYGRRVTNRRIFRHAPIPTALIPTTAGTGSEVDTYAVVTNEAGKKITIESSLIMGRYIILDPMMTLSMPPKVTAETGIDALSHCFGALLSKKMRDAPNPFTENSVIEAICLILENIEKAYEQPEDVHARSNMLWASFMAGTALTMGTVGATHGLGNSITQYLHRSHGGSIAMVIPYSLKVTAEATKEKFIKIAKRLAPEVPDAEAVDYILDKIQRIIRKLDCETLQQAAKNTSILPTLVAEAVRNSGCYTNIKVFDEEICMSVYAAAYANIPIRDFDVKRFY